MTVREKKADYLKSPELPTNINILLNGDGGQRGEWSGRAAIAGALPHAQEYT